MLLNIHQLPRHWVWENTIIFSLAQVNGSKLTWASFQPQNHRLKSSSCVCATLGRWHFWTRPRFLKWKDRPYASLLNEFTGQTITRNMCSTRYHFNLEMNVGYMEGCSLCKMQIGCRVAMESKELFCQRWDAILLWDVGTLALDGDWQSHSESESTQIAGAQVAKLQTPDTSQCQDWVCCSLSR